jgi:hypothetical protein
VFSFTVNPTSVPEAQPLAMWLPRRLVDQA